MNNPNPEIITVVDANDKVIGSENRQIVRQKGLVHRIVKVIISNPEGKMLVQQRSSKKDDNPLKWDWSATGHVDANEDYLEAALRETQEEVGISEISLTFIGKYYYERPKGQLMLRRFNGIFVGQTAQRAIFDPLEVIQIRWVTISELSTWLKSRPDDFTLSFKEIFDQFSKQIFDLENR